MTAAEIQQYPAEIIAMIFCLVISCKSIITTPITSIIIGNTFLPLSNSSFLFITAPRFFITCYDAIIKKIIENVNNSLLYQC